MYEVDVLGNVGAGLREILDLRLKDVFRRTEPQHIFWQILITELERYERLSCACGVDYSGFAGRCKHGNGGFISRLIVFK